MGYIVHVVAKSWTQQSDFHFHSSLQASLVAQMVKNPAAIWVNLGSIPGLGRSPGEGKGYPLQYPGLENSMDCIVHGVIKSRAGLSDFHFLLLHRSTGLGHMGFRSCGSQALEHRSCGMWAQ